MNTCVEVKFYNSQIIAMPKELVDLVDRLVQLPDIYEDDIINDSAVSREFNQIHADIATCAKKHVPDLYENCGQPYMIDCIMNR